MSEITLHEGDNRETLRRLIDQGVRVHSVVSDPPYGLVSVTKRFGKDGAAPAKFGTDGAFARASAGFMGSKWDGTGIERDPEFWKLVYEILLPGGYCVAFSGSRTGHWQACAMEMAGFIMHPMLGWVFGQGFPKAHNAAKAIDKELGAERKVIGHTDVGPDMTGDNYNRSDAASPIAAITETATDEAAQWEGWAYGAQALKPALDPIYVGQKPFSEKNGALNLLKHGVGAINIDGCRVAPTGEVMHVPQSDPSKRAGTVGRHPANLLHDGSAEVVALFPQTPGQIARSSSSSSRKTQNVYGEMKRGAPGGEMEPRNDAGSAARFFNAFPLDAEPIRYHPKATKADRAESKHPTVKPVALMEWLVTLVTPPGGVVLDPFAGSGTTGQAARNLGFDCILMEAEAQFAADIRRRFDLASPALDPDIAALLGGIEDDPVAALVA